MIAGAGLGVDSETLAHYALAVFDRPLHEWLHAPLAVQLALAFGDDHLRTTEARAHSFAQYGQSLLHVEGVCTLDPFDADSFHRVLDRVVSCTMLIGRAR